MWPLAGRACLISLCDPKVRCLRFEFVAGGCSMSYVQGMNILVAPFLFVMPELDSYHSFTTMLQELCPLYVRHRAALEYPAS